MTDIPKNGEQERQIRELKRTRWRQEGGGEEYQFYAYKTDPVTRLKNITEISFVLRNTIGPNVLDAGAGTGRFSIPLLQKGYRAVAVDISREMLAQGYKHAGRSGVPFSCLLGEIERLPFPDAAFDTVVSITVLRHYPDWERILLEYVRVVRPGGRVIFDMGSGDQRAFLAQKDWKTGEEPQTFDPLTFEAAVSQHELRELVAKHGLRVVLSTPYDFFHVNELLRYALGPNYDALEAQLGAYMNTQGALALCEAVTRGIFPHLSPALTSSWLIVLEKCAGASNARQQPITNERRYAPSGDTARDVLDMAQERIGAKFDEIAFGVEQTLADPDARRFYDYFRAEILPHVPVEALCWEAQS